MAEALKRNWKTTAVGITTALFGFVVFAPENFQQWPMLIALAKYAAAGGIASFGVLAADARK